ncbi:MAG: hypothetical protein RIM84_26060 [Alphaproteobacteria bacterium]
MTCEAAGASGFVAGLLSGAVAMLVLLAREWRRRGRLAAFARGAHAGIADAVAADAEAQARAIRPTVPGPSLRLGRRVWLAAIDWRARLAARKRQARGW